MRHKRRWLTLFLLSFLCLLFSFILALVTGSVSVSFETILSILKGDYTGLESTILLDVRIPRIILGLAVGGALSIAGVILQSMFRNPLVEPYTLGISGGAALGASLCVILKARGIVPDISMPVAGFIGAISVIIPLYLINIRSGFLKMEGLLLTGVMISFIASSLVMLLLAISRAEELHGIVFWIMGSLEETEWSLISIALFVSITCLFLSYLFANAMNAFVLGEEEAANLGIDVERTKKILFLLASILTGCSVAVSGIIGFVGLVVPHFVRLATGGDHRIMLILSYITGAAFLILSDTLARTVISPIELPVGVITGIAGGIIFIYAFGRNRLKGQ
ncbi:MAG: iron ABC transporter permease [Syntrophorhabdaceae bacterium]|nr:iron ABC transporter permease [Syntrophorhabdaceae bacterium]